MCHEKWKPAARDDGPGPSACSFTVSDGQSMPAWWYGDAPGRGVCLVLPDIFGPSPFYHKVASLIAREGYRTVLADYFFREGPLAEVTREGAFGRRSAMDENLCLRDIGNVVDQLAGEVGAARIGVVGFCLSGTFVLDLASARDDLATVAFYGFPEGPGGQVVSRAPRPIDVADRLRGPITAFWGDQDGIPMELVERFGAEVARHGADYRQHVYPGVGHGFLQGLVEERPDSGAARDAFDRTLEFLSAHVAGSSAA